MQWSPCGKLRDTIYELRVINSTQIFINHKRETLREGRIHYKSNKFQEYFRNHFSVVELKDYFINLNILCHRFSEAGHPVKIGLNT